MIKKELIEAFTSIAREKSIDRTNLGTIIEELFMTMIQKKYGGECDNFSVIVNMERGEIEIYQELVVVDKIQDDTLEINLAEAKKVEPDLEIGDPFILVLDPAQFGRRLINLAKQQLAQKIRDIEKEAIYDEYSSRVGEIATGYVHQIQRNAVYINIDKTEFLLPKSEQIENDKYFRGRSIRGVIKSVEWASKGPEITLSRADNLFLTRLLEMEIPEIEEDIIEIKAISRAPGDRSKVVVYSSDKRIDAVGACVGMRGSRTQAISRELNNEKIDVISWSSQPEILIARALAPAKPIELYIDEDRPYCRAIFEDEELPIAIGKNGKNIKLVTDVTGYDIDAVKKSDYDNYNRKIQVFEEVSNLKQSQLRTLASIDIKTCDDFLDADRKVLISIHGFDSEIVDKITRNIFELENENEISEENDEIVEQEEEK